MRAKLGFVIDACDVGLFIKIFGKEVIDGAGFTKKKFLLGSIDFKKLADICIKFQGETRIHPDIYITGKEKKSIDYYAIWPKKNLDYKYSDDYFVVDKYFQENRCLINSNALKEVYLHKRKKINDVQSYILSNLYLFENSYYDMLHCIVGQEITKGVCVNKKKNVIQGACFLKTQIANGIEYINDGGRHTGEEAGRNYWRGEIVISKNVREKNELRVPRKTPTLIMRAT
jgi:hypothetical protein